jgi:hypothetical protein
MQKLSADGKIARKPTPEEWERIRSSATAWSEQNGGVAGDMEQFILSMAPDVITGGSRPSIPFRMALPTPSQPPIKIVIPKEPKQVLAEIRSQTCYASVRSLINFVLVLEVILMAISAVVGFLQLAQRNADVTGVMVFCGVLAGWALVLLASFAAADVIRAVVDTADIAVQKRAREG